MRSDVVRWRDRSSPPLSFFPKGVPRALAKLLDDSKKLTAERRLAASIALYASGVAEIAVGAASVAEIERINILQASLLAMRRALMRLPSAPDLALVDGNRPPDLPCAVRCVVGGDGLSLSIAAASIVAKVARDRLMTRLGVRFPHYGWETNAGYGTPGHCKAIATRGISPHHRRGFAPVRAVLQGAILLPTEMVVDVPDENPHFGLPQVAGIVLTAGLS